MTHSRGETNSTAINYGLFPGSNIYCLDKNYGGVLIIWDRIFGTYQEEKPNEEIIYGLVVQQPSFNPLFLQVNNFHFWKNSTLNIIIFWF